MKLKPMNKVANVLEAKEFKPRTLTEFKWEAWLFLAREYEPNKIAFYRQKRDLLDTPYWSEEGTLAEGKKPSFITAFVIALVKHRNHDIDATTAHFED